MTGGEESSGESVLYSGRVSVHSRSRLSTWVQWNPHLGGGPTLEVGTRTVRVLAPRGMLLESRDISFPATDAVMWRERFGLLGMPLLGRDSIRLSVRGDRLKRELAFWTSDDPNVVWDSLVQAGVRTKRDN